jgi:hypothetical protein
VKNRYDTFRLHLDEAMKQKIVFALVSVLTACFNVPLLAHACSVCLTGADDPTADAFNWSVIFLMATPYTVVGSIAGWLFYTYRRSAKQQKQGTGDTAQPRVHLTWNPEERGR